MKRITKILCVLVLALALPVSLLLIGFCQPSYYREAYYAELADMYDRLYEAEGKKIVVVSDLCDEARNVVAEVMTSLSAVSEENAASAEETMASMEELPFEISDEKPEK